MVKLEKISKHFNGRQVLAGVDMTIAADKVTAVLGPSGAGKTTLLRILSRSIAPESGNVVFGGKKTAYVFQEPRLLPWRTALENVTFSLKCEKTLSKKERSAIGESLLRKMGLGEFIHYYPAQLSGGMKQRVAIARAFAVKPDLLLLDEPFSALDMAMKNSIYQMLLELLEWQPTTVVLVTHDYREAARLADHVFMLAGAPGRVCRELELPEQKMDRGEAVVEGYCRTLTCSMTPSGDDSGGKGARHRHLQKLLVPG